MNLPKKMRSEFSWDEAIFLAKLSKEVYEVFQQKKSLEGTELLELYNLLYPKEDWALVHIISNNDTNIRGLIFKHQSYHQYAVVFRGSILTENGLLELTDMATDVQWELVKYAATNSPKNRAVQGFLAAYESVADQIKIFFKTLTGQLEAEDFQELKQLNIERRLACVGAIADAGAVRLGASFGQQVRESIFQGLKNQGISSKSSSNTSNNTNNNGVKSTLDLEQSLIDLGPVTSCLEVYVTGHSLGGCLANLCALSLKQQIKNDRLHPKVYTFGTPKVGNQFFADYYDREIGRGFSYRVENSLDMSPRIPLPLPFPLNLITGSGIRVGEFYLGDYAGVGEVHTVTGLGSQGVSLNFGGALEFLGGIPFPHSFDTYIQLLEQQQQLWIELLRPVRTVMADLIGQLLQGQNTEITENLQQQIQAIQGSVDEMRNQIQIAQHPDREVLAAINSQEILGEALPRLKPDLLAKVAAIAQPLTYAPGSAIVRQGDQAHRFYVIARGKVEVILDANGESRLLREMGPGEYFGEIGVLSGGVRTATVRAKTEGSVQVVALDREGFKLMISESEATATQLAYRLAERAMATPLKT
ncbi:MAG: cyclic nucleotide-binding domain-containing protein [Hormoscilla sp. GM7CHS1pb]|nr:cyclic nucleotide-binding domain-containing protein [Hormoscilla sp. GM7CHS1pb]